MLQLASFAVSCVFVFCFWQMNGRIRICLIYLMSINQTRGSKVRVKVELNDLFQVSFSDKNQKIHFMFLWNSDKKCPDKGWMKVCCWSAWKCLTTQCTVRQEHAKISCFDFDYNLNFTNSSEKKFYAIYGESLAWSTWISRQISAA